jgi:hypothetical protein
LVQALIDYLNAPTVVPLQRVLDNFSGDTINERWNFTDHNGTNSGAIHDGLNEGYRITTGTSSGNNASINFNDISHYDNTGCSITASTKHQTSSSFRHNIGFAEDMATNNIQAGAASAAISGDTGITSNYTIRSSDGTTLSTTIGSIAFKTDTFMKWKLDVDSTSLRAFIDDVLDIVKTTNLPDQPMEPFMKVQTLTGTSRYGSVRYLEAYNL